MKVLHLPSDVGGHAWGLSRAERFHGLDSSVLVVNQNWMKYSNDIHLNLGPAKTPWAKVQKMRRLAQAFLDVRGKFDVFHFNFGSSLLHFPGMKLDLLDVPFYPKKAKLFATYQGCDIRQKYPTMERAKVAACFEKNCYQGQCNSGELDDARRRGITKMAQHVTHIWALNPDLMYFMPPGKASFLPYSISWEHLEPAPPDFGKKKLTLVHAPTQREAKGSLYILAALEKLQRTHGDHFEVKLVEGMSQQEAFKIFRQADLVIDQVLIGWYGGFAVECMKMGKPVIARIAQEDLHFIPPDMARQLGESVIHADPSTIYEVLKRCVEDRAYLAARAQAGVEYVHRWHDPKYVATLTRAAYEKAF